MSQALFLSYLIGSMGNRSSLTTCIVNIGYPLGIFLSNFSTAYSEFLLSGLASPTSISNNTMWASAFFGILTYPHLCCERFPFLFSFPVALLHSTPGVIITPFVSSFSILPADTFVVFFPLLLVIRASIFQIGFICFVSRFISFSS